MSSKILEVKHTLLNQIEQYLNNEITRKAFGYVEENKEYCFCVEMKEAYNLLKSLCDNV